MSPRHAQESRHISGRSSSEHRAPQPAGGAAASTGNMLADIQPINQRPANASEAQQQKSSASGTAAAAAPQQTLKQQVSPICSRRLKPIRQRTKNAFLNILENGEVCLEFLRSQGGRETIADVCRILPDGMRIVLYRPAGAANNAASSGAPPPLPLDGSDAIYAYENLPAKHWKKYVYAARFVKVVRAKTPKVTYYSSQAKLMLMENGPDPDAEAAFYQGGKVKRHFIGDILIVLEWFIHT